MAMTGALRLRAAPDGLESNRSAEHSCAGNRGRTLLRVASRVEIKLPGGRGGSVDMASDEDADALTTILGQLESAAGRSSRRRVL